jgi:hypothetical protein
MNISLWLRIWVLQLLSALALSAATHTLTINTNGNGSVARNPTNSVYPQNSIVTLTALPANGWQFSSWSGDISGALNPTNVLMNADKAITANFSQIPSYTLIVNVSGNGSVSLNPPGGNYLSNTVVSLAATASNGWVFHHWSGDASGSANPLSVTMSGHKSVIANFIQPLTITTHPQNATTSPGSTTNFAVAASGTAPLSYQWRFNNSPIAGATSATLTFSNVQLANAGNYQVVVSNPYESITSAVAMLTVTCSGTNVVLVATDTALRSAVAIGGNVRLCFSGTITLTNTIDVTRDVVLDGSGVSMAISGNNAIRLFNISTGVVFTVSNVMLIDGLRLGTNGASAGANPAQNGESVAGGAIYNAGGIVRLVSCVLSNNTARGGNGGSGSSSAAANGAGGHATGGAIYNFGGGLFLQNSLLISTVARGGDGGTYADGITPSPYGTGGSAIGGAVCNEGGSVTVFGSLFSNNVALAAAGALTPRPIARGGALFQSGGSLQSSNTLFIANRAQGAAAGGSGTYAFNNGAAAAGGAINVAGGVTVVRLAAFRSNSASGGNSFRFSGLGEAFGGAIFNSAEMKVFDSDFSANVAQAGAGGDGRGPASGWGGAIFNGSVLEISHTLLASNVAYGSSGYCVGTPLGSGGTPAFGGAVCNVAGTSLRATNCTIAINRAVGGAPCSLGTSAGGAYGGGIYSMGAMITLVNTTVAGNAVTVTPNSFRGGSAAGANIANTNGTLGLRNSLLAYPGTNANVWGTVNDSGYNMSSDGSANFSGGSSFNFTDPKLLPLANYGGPTLTMALAADSPAIDWAPATGAPPTDQRGVTRPYGAGVDLGAFEVGPNVPTLSARRNGSSVNISFPGEAGLSYRIEQSSDLITWELEETTGVLNANGVVTRSYQMTEPIRFYRLALDF